jgi:hypothetical protein
MRAMRRPRLTLSVLAALLLAVTATLLATGGSSAAPSKSQSLFRKTLLEDAKTTSAVKNLLRGGGIVAPDIAFADLTGDGRSDAVVLVDNGGVAGAVALYVFSTDGEAEESDLRAVYRSQRLYRASVEIASGRLIVRTPRFTEGDDVCCPAKIVERTYAWNDGDKTLRLRSSEEMEGPTG